MAILEGRFHKIRRLFMDLRGMERKRPAANCVSIVASRMNQEDTVTDYPTGRGALPTMALICSSLLAALAACASSAGQDPAADAERERRNQAKRAATRPIAAGESYWIEELTSLEVRDRIADGTSVVIVPAGGIEENGPFLSTGKHNLILEALCPELARRLENALCAPIVKFVPADSANEPSGAMRFPGTIRLRADTYEALLDDIASSLRDAGFSDIVMIGDSGGNQAGMEAVANYAEFAMVRERRPSAFCSRVLRSGLGGYGALHCGRIGCGGDAARRSSRRYLGNSNDDGD